MSHCPVCTVSVGSGSACPRRCGGDGSHRAGHCGGKVLCKRGGLSSARCIQQQLPPAIPAGRREDFFSFSNCYASDYSHIWHKLLLTACIQWRDNIYHVQCLVCSDVQIPVAAVHAAEEMDGGGL